MSTPGVDLWQLALCLLLVSGVVALTVCTARTAAVRVRAQAHAQRIDLELRFLQLRVSARTVWVGQLGAAGAAAVIAAATRSSWPLALIVASAFAPGLWLARARRERTSRIEQQLDGFLLALANSLRSNPALGGALSVTADVIAAPLSRELAVVLREQRLGVPLDRALQHMSERARSPVLSAALAILRIAEATGGDLSQTLETAAASLREMARLEGVVRAKTAEGRAQTVVIAVAPFALVGLLHEIDAALLMPLWTTAMGQVIAAAAALLWALALLLARKIAAVDV